jgi:hypothetical protein
MESIGLTSALWSKVLGGPYGKLTIYCFFFIMALFVAMGAYIDMHTSPVLAHYSTVCVPHSFIIWKIVMPIVMILWLLITLCIIRFCHGTGAALTVRQVLGSDLILDLLFVVIFCFLVYAPLTDIDGFIVKENSSNALFQLLTNCGEKPTVCPNAYPISFLPDNIGDMFSNSTCESVPFSDLCPIFSPLLNTNLSEVFRCQPDAVYDFESFVSYLMSRLKVACNAMNFGLIFAYLFTSGYASLSRRHWYHLD